MSDEQTQTSSTPDGEPSVDPQSIEGLFLTALAKDDPTERERFLNEVCEGDTEKRQRIVALLRAYDDAGSFFEKPPVAAPTITEPQDFDFLEPSDDPSLLGQLGPYEIYEVIGRGGMGIVFRARDPKLNRVVAVKVLAPELAANPNAKRRFVREAQAGAAISHPHVVTIHAVDDEEKLPFLVMECIVGQSLQQKIDKVGSLRLIEVLRISKQIAEGLAAAHQQGLIHRDIKPANVLLENSIERVKITDFGLARAIDDVSVTRTGEVAGSPQFMSPEQAQGERVDHRSDLFSLGCVMYAMCAGRSPFRATSIAAAIRRVCDDEPRPLAEINPEVPQWLVFIIQRLLQKNPEQRFQSADELVRVLEAHLAGIGNAQAQSEIAAIKKQVTTAQLTDTDSPRRVVQPDEEVPVLQVLSSSFFRLALLGPLITLLAFCLWAMFPKVIDSRFVPYLVMSVMPALWCAGLIGWLGSHSDRVEWGNEAYFKGWAATLLSFISPPLWILGIPTGIAGWWILSQPSVRELYRSRKSEQTVSLAIPGHLLGLGVLLGAILTSVAGLLIINDRRFGFADLAETLPAAIGLALLVLPLRGRLYRGRFWRDFAIGLSGFSIVVTFLLIFSRNLPQLRVHDPLEIAIAMFFLGISLGLPGVAIWKTIVKPWLNGPVQTAATVTTVSGRRDSSRKKHIAIGIILLIALIVVSQEFTTTQQLIPDTTFRDISTSEGSIVARTDVKAKVPEPASQPFDPDELVGTWIVDGTQNRPEPETIEIEYTSLGEPAENEDGWFRLSFTDVGGTRRRGTLGLSPSKNLFSLTVRHEDRSRQEWHGTYQVAQDELDLEFKGVNVTGPRPRPVKWSRIGEQDFSPRKMDGTTLRLKKPTTE
jgi:serine/threonine protein kinase